MNPPSNEPSAIMERVYHELHRAAARADLTVSDRWRRHLAADIAAFDRDRVAIRHDLTEHRGWMIDFDMLTRAASLLETTEHPQSEFVYAAVIEAIVARMRGLASKENPDRLPPAINAR